MERKLSQKWDRSASPVIFVTRGGIEAIDMIFIKNIQIKKDSTLDYNGFSLTIQNNYTNILHYYEESYVVNIDIERYILEYGLIASFEERSAPSFIAIQKIFKTEEKKLRKYINQYNINTLLQWLHIKTEDSINTRFKWNEGAECHYYIDTQRYLSEEAYKKKYVDKYIEQLIKIGTSRKVKEI